MNRLSFPLLALSLLSLGHTALAEQYEVKGGNFNSTFMAGPPNPLIPPNPSPTSAQFASVGQTTGAAGPIGPTQPLYAEPVITEYKDRYPATATKAFVLVRASIGGNFASGLPRYNMGDEILPPLVNASGVAFTSSLTDAAAREAEILAQARAYWHSKPVLPGESVNANTPQPLGSVFVTNASVNTATVTVTSVPSELVLGASMLGQPVARILGNTITLAGNANTTITNSTSVPVTPSTSFYYSPHSEKVYASQPGRVSILWVTRVPDGSSNYGLLPEEFAVSSTTTRPVRTIYWTESGFDGPKVQITDSRITTVSPAYYNLVPKAVPEEVTIPGYTSTSPNLTTLSFQRYNGVGQLSAYNVEGRVLVEYLGNVRAVGNVHESLGSDVVNLARVPLIHYPTVHLGKEISPHDKDPTLTPSPVLAGAQNAGTYYGTVPRANGSSTYYAERETGDPKNPDDGDPISTDAFNKVAFYWMEEADFSIKWPKFQDRYWLRWSPHIGPYKDDKGIAKPSDYAHYTVDEAGSTAETGVAFTGGSVPQLVYQDDPAQQEAQIDLATQRLFVTFSGTPPNRRTRNRSLLKFSNSSAVWYVNLYTQAEARAKTLATTDISVTTGETVVTVGSTVGLEVGMVITGPGITGVARIARIIDTTRFVLVSTGTAPVQNPSFEINPVPAYPGYASGPHGISGWTYSGNASNQYGINISDGPFANNGVIPDGMKAAFIQGIGALSTVITGLTVGMEYTLSLDVNARLGAGFFTSPTLKLSVNGISKPSKTVTAGAYQTETVTFTASGTTANFKVENLGSDGDNTLLLDHLRINPPVGPQLEWTYTVESDAVEPINTLATVGTCLEPPAGHEKAGFISSGRNYYPAGYLNPFVLGVPAANLGAIIPVNARPTDRVLKVRWFKKVTPPSAGFQAFYVPGKWGTYTVSYPASTTPQIVIAQGVGTDDLPPAQANGSVYYQNEASQVGYNPNEEHALMLGGRAYALREDLNVYPPVANYAPASYTSEPFVLVAYTDPADDRPRMHAYKVVREDATYAFDYTATAGTLLVKPYPLPLMPLALKPLPEVDAAGNRVSKDLEIIGIKDDPANDTVDDDPAYAGFIFKDRKGFPWVHRGPHAGGTPGVRSSEVAGTTVTVGSTSGLVPGMRVTEMGSPSGTAKIVSITDSTRFVLSQTLAAGTRNLTYGPTLEMKFYYTSRTGFFIPGPGEPAVGTILPFLRAADRRGQPLDVTKIDSKADGTDRQIDEPLTILYRPSWPTDAPELRVGETLTLPKFGLPQVRGQASAQVFYQQSIARDAGATEPTSDGKKSVTLHDPTREKTVALDAAGVDLIKLPSAIATTSYQGKTYFQRLPPHLQKRFYFDPVRGTKGTLVFTGTFHDEIAGEDYLDLNLLTVADEVLLKGLVQADHEDKTKWDAAIEALNTPVETFIPDTAKLGTYTVDLTPGVTKNVGENELAIISHPNTAVDSYAVTATGQGTGFVTMVFGNGNAFTPEGDPVQIQIFKISDQLYVGDLKVISSSNPLDEQVTLRHSADFAGKPEQYEFEWRWATGEASAPQTYATEMTKRIGDPAAQPTATDKWVVVIDPGAKKASEDQIAESDTLSLPSPVNVRRVTYDLNVTTVTVGSTADLSQGMTVTGPGIVGTATIQKIIDSTRYRLSKNIPDATNDLIYDAKVLSGTSTGPATVTVSSTLGLKVGMVVSGLGITGNATIVSIIDGTRYMLSQSLFTGTKELTHVDPALVRTSASATSSSLIDINDSYTDAEIAAGYPSVFLKSKEGVNFGPTAAPLGIPDRIVFSAQLGSLDGFVLYVNGRVALAHNAPTPQFTLTNASTGLTTTGLQSKQFSLAPSYFTTGPNTIEVAIYTTADPNALSELNFMLEASDEADKVTTGTVWQSPGGQNYVTSLLPLGPSEIVGGAVTNAFGGPQFVLNDRWFTMRYRPKKLLNGLPNAAWTLVNGAKLENDPTTYSRWMPPQFVEGWIKRVLAAINPFEQRVKDLYNNQVSTDVSVITQAGTRWEGDVALTLDNINDVGLIAIYETVLNRAKNMSIDANTNDPDTNNALLLAAGYLNDLYTLIGNEAYADAANPTISLDDQTSITEVNTSRFSFEGQVASSLDEELALLKGRDDSVSPGVIVAPAYNRLFWNYTRGINGGEVIYAVNYNIKEKVGSSTADGVIDEADAQRMFPQGHGDAYGHYLTALTGYYRLLTNENFTWTPRAEAVSVLGQPVTVDFQDERKFAAAAGNVARTAQQVLALVYRQNYKDDPAAGWEHYHDSELEITGRAQGLDEWASRSTQGALFHWAVANAMLPDVDDYHTGVQKIDRTTVPEIQELVTAVSTFQTVMDNANAHLNPLGLSPGAIAFDISPAFLEIGSSIQGKSHFEQIYDRSLASLVNASGAFNQAATMTRSLRNQQNQLDDYNTVIVQQEKAYVNQLIDIYGRPYSGDIGPGKLYAQGYTGPDLQHWFIVDRPNNLVNTSLTQTVNIMELNQISYSPGIQGIVTGGTNAGLTPKTVTIQPSQWVQYKDVWDPGLGSRSETGELQSALQDAQQTWLGIKQKDVDMNKTAAQLSHKLALFSEVVATHKSIMDFTDTKNAEILKLERLVRDLEFEAETRDSVAEAAKDLGDAVAEFLPTAAGLANDVTSGNRGAAKMVGLVAWASLKATSIMTKAQVRHQENKITETQLELERTVLALGFSYEQAQVVYELAILYNEANSDATELMQLAIAHQQALQQVNNVIAKGNRILAEREVFRQRAAAIIQGYRTKDLGFRIFRNEALEQYRSLFDLASRYTYLAAKSYDYETGLLGTTQGQTVFSKIVSSRSLGDLTGGVPQATTSTLGDAGLAGTMARLNADFSVAEGRLGINNPDQYGTVFSLRAEKFRIRTDQAIVADDDAWRQTMEQYIKDNVLTDSDVATYCRNIKKPDGTPVPGIVIPFCTTIQHAKNFFGLDYLPGDHSYTPSSFATKIYNVGIALPGYVGMDAYATGSMNSGAPASNDPNALGATPYVYLIPCGNDYMLAPPLGDTNTLRSWTVNDQALPLPFNLGANDFNSTQFFNANGTLSEQPWIIRKHQAFRMVSDPSFFYSSVPTEFTNSRLIGRSVWNGMWKIVIPAYTLHSDEQEGLNRFAASVKDIQIFLRTYSHSGN